MSRNVATIISRVFEPALTLTLTLFVGAIHLGLSFWNTCGWLLILVGPIICYRLWARFRLGLDWDIKDRKRRIKPFATLLILLFIDFALVRIWEPRFIPMLITYIIWVSGFLVITALWTKISGHAAGNALATGFLIQWFGWDWWPILLIVPIIAWARVVRKDHTIWQVVAGATYSWLLLVILDYYFIL